MHILVDNGSYDFCNVGDTAMLQMLVERLRQFLSGVRLSVLTAAPSELHAHCPGVTAVPTQGPRLWLQERCILGPLYALSPCLSRYLMHAEDFLRLNATRTSACIASARMQRRDIDPTPMMDYLRAVQTADAVVASGGGYLTDVFDVHATATFHTLRLAQKHGRPTALFGQGIGPIEAEPLRSRAACTLAHARLIALREQREGPVLLGHFNVARDRIAVTGDDAIELAYRECPPHLGSALGVNVRLATYADAHPGQVSKIGHIIKTVAERWATGLCALPISFYEGQDDLGSIRQMLGDDVVFEANATREPLTVIRQTGRCRVVLTGSYHAGVFALSQGIPVVALARSRYYKDKFLGLMDAFGPGCSVVSLDDSEWEKELMDSLTHSWHTAEELRPALLAAAERQIAAGRATYARFASEVRRHA